MEENMERLKREQRESFARMDERRPLEEGIDY